MEIIFNYNGKDLFYQCKDTKEKIKDIFHNIRNDININSIIFIYSGKQIKGNLSISEIINSSDLDKNKMIILITENKNESNPLLKYPKDIICPKCGESAKINIAEYKILLQCINGHNIGNIIL